MRTRRLVAVVVVPLALALVVELAGSRLAGLLVVLVRDRKMLAKMLEREAQRKAQEKVEREFKAALRRARVRIPRVGLPLPSLPVAVPAPHRGKQPRRQRWRDDIFTPDQLAIIARVQNRGRAA